MLTPTPRNGLIQGLSERLKTTVLSSQAYRTSFQYHRAIQKGRSSRSGFGGRGGPVLWAREKSLGTRLRFSGIFTALSTALPLLSLRRKGYQMLEREPWFLPRFPAFVCPRVFLQQVFSGLRCNRTSIVSGCSAPLSLLSSGSLLVNLIAWRYLNSESLRFFLSFLTFHHFTVVT